MPLMHPFLLPFPESNIQSSAREASPMLFLRYEYVRVRATIHKQFSLGKQELRAVRARGTPEGVSHSYAANARYVVVRVYLTI